MRDEATVVGDRVAALQEPWHLNAIGPSRVLRFPLGFLTGWAGAFIVWVVVLLGPLLLSAQTLHYPKSPDVRNGQRVYKGGCIACHGSEGKGRATSKCHLAGFLFLWHDSERLYTHRLLAL